MTANKVRLIGPGGGVFVPNVDQETINQKLETGEWKPIEPPKPAKSTDSTKKK